ncbi:BZ3500_MvSof-1268-A1-R1_Chr3-1g05867 [Microbotryum saponariae]|uniref:BZ3500_MvSof-1268-A1-R1_Chr3-1g05795 protein n=1 Tax=Microbotryum saponariae TaxID=289078 RepID=A0A2X0NII7_9BASI|nr:BZ3500_MvSof-1268-A1-R1_Chr3-1g05795 [Microbotryum saponariae]SCZ99193.1 BZ3500_MvSof-1268-A1-R1_Chr3-1g05867 [Microbotryum saponariae]SDA04985.1 BZ3501_MvSof-1269-A2-R1_Chr3-1g05465 [Microbotryum saponariae]SDA05057.1 BZ3501_MvSof-1269-A2-R1_Chr3-1g05537 [Microbotryum saponariae]
MADATESHNVHGILTRRRPKRRPNPPPSPLIPSLDYLWRCTRDTGEQQMEGCVELRLWCTDDAKLFQRTTAGDLRDLASFAGSAGPGDTLDETDDNTNEGVDFDMRDHSSDNLSHHSIDATDNGAFRLKEWDFNAEDDGTDDETWCRDPWKFDRYRDMIRQHRIQCPTSRTVLSQKCSQVESDDDHDSVQ